MFDDLVVTLTECTDCELELEWFGWINSMRKHRIVVSFSAAGASDAKPEEIRCAIALAVSDAMLMQGTKLMVDRYDLEANLHANVLI